METRNDKQKCPQAQEEQKSPKSRLERWIEKLEARIAPCRGYYCGFHDGKELGQLK